MSTIVAPGTIFYLDINRIKKRHQISFRRFLQGKTPAKEISKYLGLSRAEMRDWINQKMLPGMTWNNYGEIWVVDHVVPLRLFDMTKEDDLKVAWHYKNLFPLFKKDNLHKEGDLRFSLMLLNRLEKCETRDRLIECATLHIKNLDKYLK